MATDARIKKNECIRGKQKGGYFIIGIAFFLIIFDKIFGAYIRENEWSYCCFSALLNIIISLFKTVFMLFVFIILRIILLIMNIY